MLLKQYYATTAYAYGGSGVCLTGEGDREERKTEGKGIPIMKVRIIMEIISEKTCPESIKFIIALSFCKH